MTATELRAWAKGIYPLEAGVELALRDPVTYDAMLGAGAILTTDGSMWVDASAFAAGPPGYLSGGERRYYAVAACLLGGPPVNLADVLPGMDRGRVTLILAALAHAAGSHEQDYAPRPTVDGRLIFHGGPGRPGPLVAWPE